MKSPLVTVRVLTYNSAKYVVETLESVKLQSYSNIELVISDDGSTDDTIKLCENWLENNSYKFVNTVLLRSDVNTGVSANANRSINASNGEWLKGIGADDVLDVDCIKRNLEFVGKSSDILIVHSAMTYYDELIIPERFIKVRSFQKYKISQSNVTAYEQYKLLLYGCTINTPSLFVNRKVYEIFGLYDESIRQIEDWPFFLKLTRSNCKIFYFDNCTIKYRVRSESISNERIDGKIFNDHFSRQMQIYKKLIFPNQSFIFVFFYKYLFAIQKGFNLYNLNTQKALNIFMYKLFVLPFSIYERIIKRNRL